MATVKLYTAIARAVGAAQRCEIPGATCAEGGPKHRARIDALVREHCPSGSGFDMGTKFDHDRSKPYQRIRRGDIRRRAQFRCIGVLIMQAGRRIAGLLTMIRTQRELRVAFWRDHPNLSRRLISGEYCTDTRVAWCDYIDACARAGYITAELAQRATLQPSPTRREYEIQGNYGSGWETENTETTYADARRSLREYRENGPGQYRIVTRRVKA